MATRNIPTKLKTKKKLPLIIIPKFIHDVLSMGGVCIHMCTTSSYMCIHIHILIPLIFTMIFYKRYYHLTFTDEKKKQLITDEEKLLQRSYIIHGTQLICRCC